MVKFSIYLNRRVFVVHRISNYKIFFYKKKGQFDMQRLLSILFYCKFGIIR